MSHQLYEIAPSFELAAKRWPDALNLQQHYEDLKTTYEKEGSSIIELAKSFLEMVCHTVLDDLDAKKPEKSNPSTSELFSCVRSALKLDNVREVNGLGDILSGYNKLTKGLVALRDNGGTVAHGKDSYFDRLSTKHVKIFLLAAESVISFILEAFDGIEPNLSVTREPYERFIHLNEKIDLTTRIKAEVDDTSGVLNLIVSYGTKDHDDFNLSFNTSEVLYKLDREAYVEVVNYIKGIEVERDEEIVDQEFEDIQREENFIDRKFKTIPGLEIKHNYNGKYADLSSDFVEYLSQKKSKENSKKKINQFVSSILSEMEKFVVVDWKYRENILSEVRLYLKRIIRVLKIKGISTTQVLEWLLNNIEEPSNN